MPIAQHIKMPEPKIVYRHIAITDRFGIEENKTPAIGVNELAEAIADTIERTQDTKGEMIGIFGQWGRGKTFLAEQIEKYLTEHKKDSFYTVHFQAWQYQDTPAIWAYLYESFAEIYYKTPLNPKNRFFKKILNFLKLDEVARIFLLSKTKYGIFSITIFVISLLLFFTPFFPKAEFILKIMQFVGWWTFISFVFYYYFFFRRQAIQIFNKYFSKYSFQATLGIQAEIFKELKLLLKAWIPAGSNQRILLIIDDIDRCSEEKIIEIVDALRVILDDEDIHKRLIIIACIDERILERAIQLKYNYLDKNSSETEMDKLVTEYIDKLFIAAIKLPELTEADKEELFRTYTKLKCSNPPLEQGQETEEKELTSKEIPERQENVYEIADDEQKNLIRALKCIKNVTPRKIRIFYYRYLLARRLTHILTIDKKQGGIKKEFASPNLNISKDVYPLLILFLINKAGQQYRVVMKPKKINIELYQLLAKIIDIVVAY